MSHQSPDELTLCGTRFGVEAFGGIPAEHPQIVDLDKPVPGKGKTMRPRASSCTRGYVAEWEINDAGELLLTSVSGRYQMQNQPIRADWVSAALHVPIGEVDETAAREYRGYLEREANLELHVVDGRVGKWRISKRGQAKAARWNKGFDGPKILAALENTGIGPDFQPPRAKPKQFLNFKDHAKIAAATAELLDRALHGAHHGEPHIGATEIDPDAWRMLSHGWADPLPKLDVHTAIKTLRGHGPER